MESAITQSTPRSSSRRYKSRHKMKPKNHNTLDIKNKLVASVLVGMGLLLLVALGVIAYHVVSPTDTVAGF